MTAASSAAPPLSDRLLAANAERWERAQTMQFVRDVTEDQVADRVFARYLVFERSFVDTAARLCGAAVHAAPEPDALLGHATALHNLVTEQYDYFTDILDGFGGPPTVSPVARDQAEELGRTVLTIATTYGYPGIVTSLFTAEEMYRQWCATAARTPSRRPPVAEWVDLHTREPFLAQVRFLRGEVDRLAHLDDEQTLAEVLGRTVDAEIDFHDAAYTD